MLKWEIRNARPEDAELLVANMRDDDRKEIEALGMSPLGSMEHSIKHSHFAKTVVVEGEIAIIFGAVFTSVLTGKAMPWFCTSKVVDKHLMWFARYTKRYLPLYFSRYECLENIVDARYNKSINWLKWLGFKVDPPIQVEPYGEMFCKFTLKEFV
jgi:hypothetical protein